MLRDWALPALVERLRRLLAGAPPATPRPAPGAERSVLRPAG
jgi:hypothetical protein